MAETAPAVQPLIAAVRGHLWREDGLRIARRAAWASALAMLLATVVHLAATSVAVDIALLLLGAVWVAALGAAAARRPTDQASALWIDRRLGGASAFTTLLEASSQAHPATDPHALRRLERWTSSCVPEAMKRLADQPTSTRIAPALLSMAVCTALALVVLTLPEAGATFRGTGAASAPSGPADAERRISASPPIAERAAATQLASDLSSALRAQESPSDPEQRASRAPSRGPADPDRRAGEPGSPSSAPAGDASAGRASASSAPNESTANAGSLQPSEKVSGRAAGDSPDARADVGVSRMAGGTMTVKRTGSKAALAQDRQADMAKATGFDDGSAQPGGAARSTLDAAAAAPPPATDTARLSPAETHYVQAWMKASGRNR